MRLLAIVAAVVLTQGWAAPSVAEPVTFKCKTDSGSAAADLVIDLDKRTLTWGGSRYEIRNVTSQYITAIEWPDDKVGAEVWVFDRNSGEYQRAIVAIMRTATPGAPNGLGPPALTRDTYRGTCSRPII